MKKTLLYLALLLVSYQYSFSQSAPYNVVFDVTSPDTMVHKMVIRWISEVLDSDPNANIEVVFYAKSLGMVTTGNSVVSDAVVKYAGKSNVDFKVCQVALRNNDLDKSRLLPGVTTVPDGIYEIISRQHDGWGYIKAAR